MNTSGLINSTGVCVLPSALSVILIRGAGPGWVGEEGEEEEGDTRGFTACYGGVWCADGVARLPLAPAARRGPLIPHFPGNDPR